MGMLEGSGPEAPPIAIEAKLINDDKGAGDSQHVAAEDVNDHVVPPAFLEIVENVP